MNGTDFSEAIKNIEKIVRENFEQLSIEEMFRKPETGWSAAENLAHIAKVNRISALALSAPSKWTLIFLGKVKRPVQPAHEFIPYYKDILKNGFKAGFFKPGSQSGIRPDKLLKQKKNLLNQWTQSTSALASSVAPWSETSLRTRKILQPSLGWVPAAEMIASIMLHTEHHLIICQDRLNRNLSPDVAGMVQKLL